MIRSEDVEEQRRQLVLRALALTGFLLAGFPRGRAWAQAFSAKPVKLPEGQSIYRISGDVRVNDAPANLKTRVGPTDTVQTARDAEVIFVIGENAFLQRGASRVSFQGEPRQSLLISGFRLVTGALLSVFPQGRRINLSTQTATIGIRGTGAYAEAEPQQTYFCTCYGVTDIAATRDPESTATVAATHHDRPVYILGDAQRGQNIRTAPFINHTDQELMLIETLVGRTVPFVFPKDDYRAPRRQY